MKISNNRGIVLVVFLFCCFSISCVNSSVACTPSGNTLTCLIESTDSTLVEEMVASNLTNVISILLLKIGGEGAGLALNINLPNYITELEIDNNGGVKMNLGALAVNSGVESIKFRWNKIEITQRDFFTFFPNLKHFEANDLVTIYFPSFIQNKQLTYICVYASQIAQVWSRLIDHTLFVGLDKLETLHWASSGITGITPGSFKGLNMLTRLNLFSNMIQELKSCTFEGSGNIRDIDIGDNMITSVHPNAFLGLNKVTKLYIHGNPSIPLPAITVMKKMEILRVALINPKNILREIIQQLTGLTLIYNDYNVFNCTCDTEWISKLSSFDVTVSTFRSSCIGSSMKVDNPALYTNCEARSYQCFNKSIVCVGENWSRVDTVDGCECVYPEVSYTVSEICNDINECENSTICQGNCTNTPGSYKCSCLEGFYNVKDTLSGDKDECIVGNGDCSHNYLNSLGSFEFEISLETGYEKQGFSDCVDINECLLSNGNCSHNCSNTIGSYECSCLTGYEKQGFSGCVDINECLLSNGNCSHNCSNTIGSYECSCLTGYEKQGFSGCVDTNECLLSNGNCSHNCNNTVGSYECTCFPGYLKHGSTECSLPSAGSINDGGSHHHSSNTVCVRVCSCVNVCSSFDGFEVSTLDSSHSNKETE